MEEDVTAKLNQVEMCEELFQLLDDNTSMHSLRVARLCENIADSMGEDQSLLYMIGAFHDIGKIAISSKILGKPGTLSEKERTIINTHSWIGSEMVKKILPHAYPLIIPILFHHGLVIYDKFPDMIDVERVQSLWKYTLSDKKLRRLTSIIYMADFVDAVTSKRSYHEPVSSKDAVDMLDKSHPLYDKDVAKVLHDIELDQLLESNNADASCRFVNIAKIIKCVYTFERSNK